MNFKDVVDEFKENILQLHYMQMKRTIYSSISETQKLRSVNQRSVMNRFSLLIQYSQLSYNAVSVYRIVPFNKKLGLNRKNQANTYCVIWKPSTALYENCEYRVTWRPKHDKL